MDIYGLPLLNCHSSEINSFVSLIQLRSPIIFNFKKNSHYINKIKEQQLFHQRIMIIRNSWR